MGIHQYALFWYLSQVYPNYVPILLLLYHGPGLLYIGLGDTYHTSLNTAAINNMAACGSVPPGYGEAEGELGLDCQQGAIGRYIYFYMIGGGDAGMIFVEVEVYGGLLG